MSTSASDSPEGRESSSAAPGAVSTDRPLRILVVDDDEAIHRYFKGTLNEVPKPEAEGLGPVRLSSAGQGEEALALVEEAKAAGEPFALAFVDMHMPPGWDGLETIERFWQVDAALQIVVCTAYSDLSWAQVHKRLGVTDSLLILKKPFDPAEILQMTSALARKWRMTRDADRAFERLEELVHERTRDLEEARLKAESANLAKSEFLGAMSHEIRTPINGIMGSLSILEEVEWQDQYEEYFSILRSSADSLVLIIDDILEYTQIESGKLIISSANFDLYAFAESLSDEMGELAKQKGLTLTGRIRSEVPRFVSGDPVRLRRVLANLVDNAIKFTEKGEVLVTYSYEPEEGKHGFLTVDVSDTGIGIPAQHLERVFERFTQADGSLTRRHGGTGLGLSVSRQLARFMGGEITAESEEGDGSTFSLRMPLPCRDANEVPSVVPLRRKQRDRTTVPYTGGGRVLVVEDSSVMQVLTVRILESLGCTVDVAPNGWRALKRTEEVRYDAVFMDCEMPVLDGYEATRRIRLRDDDRVRVPIIGLTANVMEGDRQRCLDAGMDDYVAKPVEKGELRETLRQWIGDGPAAA